MKYLRTIDLVSSEVFSLFLNVGLFFSEKNKKNFAFLTWKAYPIEYIIFLNHN